MNEILFPAEQINVEKPAPPLDIWVVVANWKGLWWKVFKDTFQTKEAAQTAAIALSDCWIHRKIFRLTDKKP